MGDAHERLLNVAILSIYTRYTAEGKPKATIPTGCAAC